MYYSVLALVCFTGGIPLIYAKFETVFEWNYLNFTFDCDHKMSDYGYGPGVYHAYAVGVYHPLREVFLVLPRHNPTARITLASLSLDSDKRNPLLTPYPNWEMNSGDDCRVLQDVSNIKIGKNGIMWVLDGKRTGETQCPAKLVLLDLKSNGSIVGSYNIPEDICSERDRCTVNDIVLDEDFAYLTFYTKSELGLLVFDRKSAKFNLIREISQHCQGTNHIGKFEYGVWLALTPSRDTLYVNPPNADYIFTIPIEVLQNNRNISKYIKRDVKKITPTGATAGDSEGTIFFTQLLLSAVSERIVRDSDVVVQTFDKNVGLIRYPGTLAFDNFGYLYMTSLWSIHFHHPFNKSLINFRVLKAHTGTGDYQHTGHLHHHHESQHKEHHHHHREDHEHHHHHHHHHQHKKHSEEKIRNKNDEIKQLKEHYKQLEKNEKEELKRQKEEAKKQEKELKSEIKFEKEKLKEIEKEEKEEEKRQQKEEKEELKREKDEQKRIEREKKEDLKREKEEQKKREKEEKEEEKRQQKEEKEELKREKDEQKRIEKEKKEDLNRDKEEQRKREKEEQEELKREINELQRREEEEKKELKRQKEQEKKKEREEKLHEQQEHHIVYHKNSNKPNQKYPETTTKRKVHTTTDRYPQTTTYYKRPPTTPVLLETTSWIFPPRKPKPYYMTPTETTTHKRTRTTPSYYYTRETTTRKQKPHTTPSYPYTTETSTHKRTPIYYYTTETTTPKQKPHTTPSYHYTTETSTHKRTPIYYYTTETTTRKQKPHTTPYYPETTSWIYPEYRRR